MIEFQAQTDIAASQSDVWDILADGTQYAAWNPEIVGIDGSLTAGATFRAHVRIGSGAVRRVPLRVADFIPPTRMVWIGGLPFGLFVGERTYTVEPTPIGVVFKIHLVMRGPLSGLIGKSTGNRQAEIDAFAAGLKRRAERTRSH